MTTTSFTTSNGDSHTLTTTAAVIRTEQVEQYKLPLNLNDNTTTAAAATATNTMDLQYEASKTKNTITRDSHSRSHCFHKQTTATETPKIALVVIAHSVL